MTTKADHFYNIPQYNALTSSFPHHLQYLTQSHRLDLFCFQSCSVWTLNLASTINRSTLSSSCLQGALNQPLNSLTSMALVQSMPQDIQGYLPIDLSKNQRFVLNPTQPKLSLNIVFDLIGQMNHFTNVNNQYGMVLFDIYLIGELHGIKLLKDSIDFKVKGYDIQRSIASVLNDKGITNVITRNQFVTIFNAVVFSNIQCSFAIEFCISNYSLIHYYAMIEKNGFDCNRVMSLCNFGIVINKLKIVYNLPLCVFSMENYKGFIQYNHWSQYRKDNETKAMKSKPMTKANKHINTNANAKPVIESNFCNWHSFMTNTTPILYETETLTIKNILDSFIKPSLFGIKCIFRTDKSHYTQVNYFPSLSSISIEEVKKSITSPHLMSKSMSMSISQSMKPNQYKNQSSNSSTNVFNSLTMTDSSSFIEESTLIHCNSATEDYVSPLNKTIFHYEKTQEMFNTKTYNEQLKSFLKSHPHCSDLSLNDISPQSWFSITWTPMKANQSKGFHEQKDINWNHSSSFKVFYQFRSGNAISNSIHFIPVIGILEKNIRGRTIKDSAVTASPQSNHFWFANQSSNVTNARQLDLDQSANNNNYVSLIEKGCKLE